jgi:hypothetical protein
MNSLDIVLSISVFFRINCMYVVVSIYLSIPYVSRARKVSILKTGLDLDFRMILSMMFLEFYRSPQVLTAHY